MRFRLFLGPVLLAAATAAAGSGPPALIAVAPGSPWTLRELEARRAALVSYDPDTGVAYVLATPEEQAALAAAGFAFATVEPDVGAGLRRVQQARDLGAYHSYAETVALVESLAAAHPALCRVENLGTTGEGRDILALKISDSPLDNDASEPDVLLVGNHHAREFMSVEVPLHLARTLLEGYGVSARITQLVDEREVWIVPLLNADGHVYQEERAASPDWAPPGWRKNRRPNLDGSFGVDPNRNYGYQWGYDEDGSSSEPADETFRGPAAFSEPETQAIRRLVERQRFALSLSFHSFGKLLLYPWGYTRDVLTDDQPVFAALADSMVRGNGYRPGNAFLGTIYKTNGELCDYLYGDITPRKPRSTYAFTFELNSQSEGFWPPDSVIGPTCAAMVPPVLFAIEAAANVRELLAPPAPALVASQDPADAARIDLRWTQPPDPDNVVDHYEVFETAPVNAAASAPVHVARSGRVLLATGVQRPAGGRVALRLEARLLRLWDYAYVEARGADGVWRTLRGDGSVDTSPTGRNQGRGLTGSQPSHTAWFDVGAIPGARFDLAVRLDAVAGAPEPAWIEAELDFGATAGEVRRILDPDVRGTAYTIHAQRGGLLGYGVTAVDAQGQKTDSEVYFFLIPTTSTALTDVGLVPTDGGARLEWHGGDPGDRFTAWAWERDGARGDAAAVPGAGAQPWGNATQVEPGAGRLEFAVPPGLWWVALEVQSGTESRWFGPYPLRRSEHFGFLPAPNPMRGAGAIRYEVARGGAVEVEVCTVDGRRVRQWTAQHGAAGAYEVVWDGRDGAGAHVAAGVYWVRLRQDARVAARRVVRMD